MRSLARYILTGPVQAATVVFGFAILSFPFPALVILSGGALVLVMLQLGVKQALNVFTICVIAITIFTFFLFGRVISEPLIAWVSIMFIASIYRNTQSLNLTLQLITVIGLFFIVLISILFPDLQDQWLKHLQNLFKLASEDPSFKSMIQSTQLTADKIEKYLPIVASLITGGLVAVFLVTSSVTLFLGRWWQGVHTNAQVFRKEFIALRLGKVIAILALLFLLTGLVVKHAILWQLAIVCLSMFALQGIAIVHALLGQLSNPMFAFIAVYGLLFIAAPQMLMALSTLGVLDTFINFRKKFVKSNT